MAGGWLGPHLSHRPAEGPGLDPVKTGTVLTVEIEATKPPDAQAQNCYNVILDTSYWPQYVTRPAQTQRHGHSAPPPLMRKASKSRSNQGGTGWTVQFYKHLLDFIQ